MATEEPALLSAGLLSLSVGLSAFRSAVKRQDSPRWVPFFLPPVVLLFGETAGGAASSGGRALA